MQGACKAASPRSLAVRAGSRSRADLGRWAGPDLVSDSQRPACLAVAWRGRVRSAPQPLARAVRHRARCAFGNRTGRCAADPIPDCGRPGGVAEGPLQRDDRRPARASAGPGGHDLPTDRTYPGEAATAAPGTATSCAFCFAAVVQHEAANAPVRVADTARWGRVAMGECGSRAEALQRRAVVMISSAGSVPLDAVGTVAADLLTDLYLVGMARGITPDNWEALTSLPLAGLDVSGALGPSSLAHPLRGDATGQRPATPPAAVPASSTDGPRPGAPSSRGCPESRGTWVAIRCEL